MLILGSSSSARKSLLEQIGLAPDKVVSPNVNESQKVNENPRDYVLRIAKEKALSIPCDIKDFLITADTAVNLGTKILHKTTDRDIAKKYLKQISGRRHNVFSAVCVKHNGQLFFGVERTIIKSTIISNNDIELYLSSDEWCNRAGGYAIQGAALKFFPKILGCYSNIVGLPLPLLTKKLRASGFKYK